MAMIDEVYGGDSDDDFGGGGHTMAIAAFDGGGD